MAIIFTVLEPLIWLANWIGILTLLDYILSYYLDIYSGHISSYHLPLYCIIGSLIKPCQMGAAGSREAVECHCGKDEVSALSVVSALLFHCSYSRPMSCRCEPLRAPILTLYEHKSDRPTLLSLNNGHWHCRRPLNPHSYADTFTHSTKSWCYWNKKLLLWDKTHLYIDPAFVLQGLI